MRGADLGGRTLELLDAEEESFGCGCVVFQEGEITVATHDCRPKQEPDQTAPTQPSSAPLLPLKPCQSTDPPRKPPTGLRRLATASGAGVGSGFGGGGSGTASTSIGGAGGGEEGGGGEGVSVGTVSSRGRREGEGKVEEKGAVAASRVGGAQREAQVEKSRARDGTSTRNELIGTRWRQPADAPVWLSAGHSGWLGATPGSRSSTHRRAEEKKKTRFLLLSPIISVFGASGFFLQLVLPALSQQRVKAFTARLSLRKLSG